MYVRGIRRREKENGGGPKVARAGIFCPGAGRGGGGLGGVAASKGCLCIGDEYAHASLGPSTEGLEGRGVRGGTEEDYCTDCGVGREKAAARRNTHKQK